MKGIVKKVDRPIVYPKWGKEMPVPVGAGMLGSIINTDQANAAFTSSIDGTFFGSLLEKL